MTDSITISVAGYRIEFRFGKTDLQPTRTRLKREILERYRGFITRDYGGNVDYTVEFIEAKKMNLVRKGDLLYIGLCMEMEKGCYAYYEINQLQLYLIIRLALEKLLSGDGFFIHASASYVKDKAVLFLGKSGTGKSTIAHMLSGSFPVLADDIGIIRKEGSSYFFYQLPVSEKIPSKCKSRNRYQLGCVYFIHQSEQVRIGRIAARDYLIKQLAMQVFSEKKQSVTARLKALIQFAGQSCAYHLYFNRSDTESLKRFIYSSVTD